VANSIKPIRNRYRDIKYERHTRSRAQAKPPKKYVPGKAYY
jgi:hypothetical protein